MYNFLLSWETMEISICLHLDHRRSWILTIYSASLTTTRSVSLTWSSRSQTGAACVSMQTPAWPAGRVGLSGEGWGRAGRPPTREGCWLPTRMAEGRQVCRALQTSQKRCLRIQEDEGFWFSETSLTILVIRQTQSIWFDRSVGEKSNVWPFRPLSVKCRLAISPSRPEPSAARSAIAFRELRGSGAWGGDETEDNIETPSLMGQKSRE